MHCEIRDAAAVNGDGFEMDEWIGVKDAEITVIGSTDEVTRERMGDGGSIESEGSHSTKMINKGANLRGRCKVVDLDGVVGTTRCCDRTSGSDGLDWSGMRRVGEERFYV